ncbi:MAG TPA: class I SAM-dependent methyltransferase [Thermoleophilaceae bacterium]|nr:class I SAM-dependent methyltransferase [Thermoleophilaceae bacterium]
MTQIAPANEEAVGAWDGVLFDRFVQFREILLAGMTQFGEVALAANPPSPGDRALDIGCGFGDTAQAIAGMVGPQGTVLGVDAAARFVETAREEAAAAGVENVRFEVADVQATPFEGEFDYAFSRFGTMFFAAPVAALRNVREALVPGGTLTMVVWRRKLDNPWLHRAEIAVKELVEPDEDSDELTCGPGPFSMANADTVTDILGGAGFSEARLMRCDRPYMIGRDMDEAIALNMALGPAGEAIRLAGAQAEEVRPQIVKALREQLADWETPDGVVGVASTWVVTARNPA